MATKESVSIETITPSQAKAELEDQESRIAQGEYRQRRLDDKTINKYANDMKRGNWLVNSAGIYFDSDGNLLDGRHRLWAISRCGKPVNIIVVRGAQSNGSLPCVQDTFDSGKPRTFAQQLQIDGVPQSCLIAASVRAIAMVCAREPQLKISTTSGRAILGMYQRHFNIIKDIMKNNQRVLSSGSLLGMIAMYRAYNPERADEFSELYSGLVRPMAGQAVNLPEGSPVLAFRSMMVNRQVGGSGSIYDNSLATCLALHYWDQKAKIKVIRYGTSIGQDWLLEVQKNNARKVREILGVE